MQGAAKHPAIQARPRAQATRQMGAPGRLQPIRANAGAAPRVSTAPGQRFVPSGNGGAYMGAVPLVGGIGERQPFMGAARVGQQPQVTPPVDPAPAPEPGESVPVREVPGHARRRAWGRLKKLEAKELADYLASIAARMDELEIPSGIVRQYQEKLEGFASTAAPQAELELSESELAELDAAILAYEEVESRNTTRMYAIGAAAIAAVGIGVALLA